MQLLLTDSLSLLLPFQATAHHGGGLVGSLFLSVNVHRHRSVHPVILYNLRAAKRIQVAASLLHAGGHLQRNMAYLLRRRGGRQQC